MDALTVLKEACLRKTYKSFNLLQPGEYIVTLFEKYSSRHGDRIRITIEDTYMLLPERFNEALTDQILLDLNKSPKIMIYGGKDLSNQNRLILDFKDASFYADMFITEITE